MNKQYKHTPNNATRRRLSTGRRLSKLSDVEDDEVWITFMEAHGTVMDGLFCQHSKPQRRMSTGRKISTTEPKDREETNAGQNTCKETVKLAFMKADENGDGWLTESEFIAMVTRNVSTNDETAKKIFLKVAGDSSRITFEQFYDHYEPYFNKRSGETNEDKLTSISEKKQEDRSEKKSVVSTVRTVQNQLLFQKSPELSKLIKRSNSLIKTQTTAGDIKNVEDEFAQVLISEGASEIQEYISSRWDAFINFKRKGKDGKIVMTSEEEITDALPGSYDIFDLVMDQFDSTVIQCQPKFVKLKPVKWIPSEGKGKHGKLLCPKYWNCTIPVDIGTSQNLSYYGACFATEKQKKVALLHRHATTDFVYSANYHQDYVMQDNEDGGGAGGCGLETHAFHHMDCPLEDESGYFLLGKLVSSDEIHLTAFKIPRFHVLYVPPNVIHSNDYMVGKWRTMLADNVDIDHVHFMKETEEKFTYEHAHVEISG